MNATLALYVNRKLATHESRALATPRFLREVKTAHERFLHAQGVTESVVVSARRGALSRTRFVVIGRGAVKSVVVFHP